MTADDLDAVTAVFDHNGDARTIDVRDGRIAAAANEFKTAPGTDFKPGAPGKAAPPSKRPRPGTGQLWRIDADGRAEMLLARKDTHFTSVQWGPEGTIFAGGGRSGHRRVDADYHLLASAIVQRGACGLP